MKVIQEMVGSYKDKPVYKYTLQNHNGMYMSCFNYGCIINQIYTPDRNGRQENIVVGYDSFEEYMDNPNFLGAAIGRFAGRIKNGAFEIDGREYQVTRNEGANHLHGGVSGFHNVLWNSSIVENEQDIRVIFSYESADGEEGYPGRLRMKITYTLNENSELIISYEGVSDKKTLLNVTNHTYFNLSGDLKTDILGHSLALKSNQYLEIDEDGLPTGSIKEVRGAFDFRDGRKILEGIGSQHPQIILAKNGFDHPFILEKNHDKEISLVDYESGRQLIVETDESHVVLYTGNKLGWNNHRFTNYLGLCLETQGAPDSIHQPHFPTAIIEANTPFFSKTKYIFDIVMY